MVSRSTEAVESVPDPGETGSLAASFRAASRAAAVVVAAFGAGGLLYWSLGLHARSSMRALFGSTRLTTALCFLLAAAALWLMQPAGRGVRRLVALASATLVLAIGVFSGAEDVLWNLNLEESLSRGSAAGPTSPLTVSGHLLARLSLL